ncbi:putative multidrug resistance ABC transporter ATP-binding/permease protein YheH [Phocicoccus schoeneichii]|uniref:Putative multidrug resistance ABC transporter ATP-binding/permease protein YheH n=1 Tax=Phocicoccus schoeneichii TaxID=1812261 RepID=A0A6V7RN36_9BACL|nr:ABC transporter ATP-binding protein [Jeotgalicoccus schoeneichii]GGH55523.1 putative multidrug resistance ABC transporter ATP-binding/permease protein YheH [Jeotgalicoccus schoeneichii]CAD2079601.1 putative multidrug resistance ABC transporter ATP-binding/permease protein YheH [Jeotgalicoccus schoeneichii]
MKNFKRLYSYTIGERKTLIFGIFLSAIGVVLTLLGPLILKFIIDNYMQEGNVVAKGIITLILIYLGIQIVNSVVAYFSQIVIQTSSSRVIQKLRLKVFDHVQNLPVRYFDDLPAGKVVARITNDTEAILALFTSAVPVIIISGFTIFGIIVASFFVSFYAGLAMIVIVPIIMIWVYLYRKASTKHNNIKRERNSDINAMINESINGMQIIQAFNREETVLEDFSKINDEFYDSSMKIVKINALTNHNLIETLRSILLMILVVVFASIFLDTGTALTVGSMYLIIDYSTKFMDPLYNIVGMLDIIEQARVSTNKVYELLDKEVEDNQDGELNTFTGTIEFQDVNFSYDGKTNVLNDISFKVNPNETLALVGHTGSGKSSIINLLMRFYDPTSGRILFDDKNTLELNKQSMRKHMSIVLQDPFIYSGSLLYNIRMNNTEITEKEALDALIKVGGQNILDKLENGIHSELSERGATLSLGERQLISFARALAFNPTVLILDEATSNIDSETEQMIQNAMAVVSKDRTTFIIAHRLSTIQNADHIIVLEKGHIIEEGNHASLMQENNKYASMYLKQVTKEEIK